MDGYGSGGAGGPSPPKTKSPREPSYSPTRVARNVTEDPLVKKWMDEKANETKEKVRAFMSFESNLSSLPLPFEVGEAGCDERRAG